MSSQTQVAATLDQIQTIQEAETYWTQYMSRLMITETDEQEFQELLETYEKIPLRTLKAELEKPEISLERRQMLERMIFFEEASTEMMQMAKLNQKAKANAADPIQTPPPLRVTMKNEEAAFTLLTLIEKTCKPRIQAGMVGLSLWDGLMEGNPEALLEYAQRNCQEGQINLEPLAAKLHSLGQHYQEVAEAEMSKLNQTTPQPTKAETQQNLAAPIQRQQQIREMGMKVALDLIGARTQGAKPLD